jgi:hypothetical protein
MKAFVTAAALVAGTMLGGSACRNATAPRSLVVSINQTVTTLLECASEQLSIRVVTSDGQSVTPDSVKWSSSDSLSLSVTQSGMILAKKQSPSVRVSVTAFSAGIEGTTSLNFTVATIGSPCA